MSFVQKAKEGGTNYNEAGFGKREGLVDSSSFNQQGCVCVCVCSHENAGRRGTEMTFGTQSCFCIACKGHI